MNILADGRIWSLYSAGVGTFFTSAILEWAHQSADDTFYIIVPKGIDDRYELSDMPPNIKLLDYTGRFPAFLPNIITLQLIVPRLCRKLRIDMYYSPVPNLPLMIPSRVKTLVTVHDVVNIEMPHTMSWTNRLATAFSFGRSVRRASYLWTNSEYTRSKVEEYFPKRRAGNIIVGDALDRKVFYPRAITDDAVRNLKKGYGIKGKFILFVGSLEPRKNLQFLLSIIGDLYRENGIQLVVVGAKRWKESNLRAVIEDPGFPRESTVLCGYLSNEELATLYSMADCYVSASFMEGFGMPQLEALMCGCPVVTADNTAMTEVARSKDAAFLVDGYDPEIWKQTILQVVNNKPKVSPGQLDQYDWSLIISRLRAHICDTNSMLYINGRFLTRPMTGVERFAYSICVAMAESGKSFAVICPKGPIRKEYDVSRLNIIHYGFGGSHFWEQCVLPWFFAGKKDYMLLSLTGLGTILMRNKIMTIHDLSFLRSPSWFSRTYYWYYRFMTPLAVRTSRHILTVSEFSKSEILHFYPFLSDDKVSVIYSAINSNLFRRDNSVPAAKERFVLTVSSIDPRKNFARLLEAYNGIKGTKLYIVGNYNQIFQKQDDLLQDRNDVKFLGRASDRELLELYNQAVCFVLPSLYEGFGLPPLEAMACGCPVLVSDIPVEREICADAARYFNPYSVEDIRRTIREQLECDDSTRNEQIERGFSNITRFSWRRSAGIIIEIVEKLHCRQEKRNK